MTTYLLPIADREPLAWILGQQRTAFSAHRAREASSLELGDTLLLYTTRGCFRNPTRDRGRVVGVATIVSRPTELPQPVRFGERAYSIGIRLKVESLAARDRGVELAPLISELESFPKPSAWSARMRRALVRITERDAAVLERELARVAEPYPEALATYPT
jgi:EVE domain